TNKHQTIHLRRKEDQIDYRFMIEPNLPPLHLYDNNDITEVAKVISFNGVQRLNYWSTPQANMFNGTDGSLFPPHLNKNKDVYSYNADMCR
ncbi:unnamed protein product, partial [Adineta steineri]